MRSARMVGLLVTCGASGWLVLGLIPGWTTGDIGESARALIVAVAGAALILLPYGLVYRLEGLLSALPPDDYREHRLMSLAMETVRREPTAQKAAEMVKMLADAPASSEEWVAARKALRSWIALVLATHAGERPFDLSEVDTGRRTVARAWRAAIGRTARFFR